MSGATPTTEAGRALLVLIQDVENGLQEPIEDFTSAIVAIEAEAAAQTAAAVEAWRNLAMLAVAMNHVEGKHKSNYNLADCGAPLCDEYRRLCAAAYA